MVLRFTFPLLVLFLVFLMCDGGNAVRDLEDKHAAAYFQKSSDSEIHFHGANEVKNLEDKYSTAYFHKTADAENQFGGSDRVKNLEDKYSIIAFHKTFDADAENQFVESDRVKNLEDKYSNIAFHKTFDADAENQFGGSDRVKNLEDKYSSLAFHKTFDADAESQFGGSDRVKNLEDKYSIIAFHKTFDADAENHFGGSDGVKKLEDKYSTAYFHKTSDPETKSPQQSSKMMKDHNMEHHHHNHVESAEIGLFTIDELRAFTVGKKLPIFFPIKDHSLYPPFLPKEVADTIPFSSSQVSNILQFFSISPDSPKGKAVHDTLKTCELEAAQGETKICATSLESLLGFVTNVVGPEVDLKFISTKHPTITTPIFQNYTVLKSPREIESPKKVACHPMPYPYAIYYCHFVVTETKAFKLQLVGDTTGDQVDALVVCHMDTSGWISDHAFFRILGIKKGDPFCHVFSQGNIVWIQPSPMATSAM